MHLSVEQKSDIRHFIYYLVNGTLNFDFLHNKLNDEYHEILETSPDVFYKACCVYINQHCVNKTLHDGARLGGFVFDTIKGTQQFAFETWETDFEVRGNELNGAFKSFTLWFTQFVTPSGETYYDYIASMATFVEQCFAIWANVIVFEEGEVNNADYAIARVSSYINSYFTNTEYDIQDWEWELY